MLKISLEELKPYHLDKVNSSFEYLSKLAQEHIDKKNSDDSLCVDNNCITLDEVLANLQSNHYV